ncbi:MAG: hypothetical protein RL660_2342 [Bacteroidota bacterium]|jgi:nucleoside-diphosphate-sugar epimerase
MNKKILVAGATGNLGAKTIKYLLQEKAAIKVVARASADAKKIEALKSAGVEVLQCNMNNAEDMVAFMADVSCVVSVLAGLEDVILGTQKVLLDAAVKAGVPRFICSDYSIDYTNLVPGKNRNLDWRRQFAAIIDATNIKATSIFNGAFMDMLTAEMPLIMKKQKKILCWGNANQVMDFTHTENVAHFTALAALAESTPRHLFIAGDRMSCKDFVALMSKLSGKTYKIFRPGSIGMFNAIIKITKFFSPGKTELYPAWQGMQYMRDMMEGRVAIKTYHNTLYPEVAWTNVEQYLVRAGFVE